MQSFRSILTKVIKAKSLSVLKNSGGICQRWGLKKNSEGICQRWGLILKISGAVGVVGVGTVAYRNGLFSSRFADENTKKKKVVILGTGWGGVSLLKNLDDRKYDVVVVSPRNHFVFTPLLPSVSAGTVNPFSIIENIRRLVAHRNVTYSKAECTSIDTITKTITCADRSETAIPNQPEFKMNYDYLVIAVGCQNQTFGIQGVAENCHFLKEIDDAKTIHQNVLECFEGANSPLLSDEERRKKLSFVVVGGGPTGVEFAAELHDLVYGDLMKLYPATRNAVSITLIEATDQILGMFHKRIIQYAEEKFVKDGILLQKNCQVKAVRPNEVEMLDKKTGEVIKVPFSLAIWSTGITTRPFIKNFMQHVGQNGRVLAVDEWLRVKGCDDVYALGDCATIEQQKVMDGIKDIFELIDKDHNGKLSMKEFKEGMKMLAKRYPQIEAYMKEHSLVKDAKQEDGELDIEKFKQAVCQMDSAIKRLPPTAQVANQQGKYLAECFNRLKHCEEHPEGPVRVRGEGRHRFQPFRYNHQGSFAPLGGEVAAAEFPGDKVMIGHTTMGLWYSVYLSKQVSWRNRCLVFLDWTKSFVSGRESNSVK